MYHDETLINKVIPLAFLGLSLSAVVLRAVVRLDKHYGTDFQMDDAFIISALVIEISRDFVGSY